MMNFDNKTLPDCADRPYDLAGKRVFVTGHRGMVGQAIVRRLQREDVGKLLTATRSELDLTRQDQVEVWMKTHRPDVILHAAGLVGGILANSTYPADFLYQNMIIAGHLVEAAFQSGVEKFIFLGSSCIYPKLAPQPIPEDALLTGPLEPTNEAYAVAKIAGVKLCQTYREQHGVDYNAVMPTNLYGPGDNFDLKSSHVIPALMRKAHEAKISGESSMTIWGSGTPTREFMHVDDCADGCIFVLKHMSRKAPINLGSGQEVTIKELAETMMRVVGLEGDVKTDTTKPDGTPRKLMDSETLLNAGWSPSISLESGLLETYRHHFLSESESNSISQS